MCTCNCYFLSWCQKIKASFYVCHTIPSKVFRLLTCCNVCRDLNVSLKNNYQYKLKKKKKFLHVAPHLFLNTQIQYKKDYLMSFKPLVMINEFSNIGASRYTILAETCFPMVNAIIQ